ncbi:MAG: RluA family pseudouridine synthase [Verrucomicrobiota bacterium]|nr:RluA family pseudouridine synthase [Verrucomicrobiota bacterium]
MPPFIFHPLSSGDRLDHFLAHHLKGEHSRSLIQKWIKSGHVTVNEIKTHASYSVKEGDKIILVIPEVQPVTMGAEDIPLSILYEDSDLLVVNKPPGMVIHPGAGHTEHTLVNALLSHCRGSLSGIGGFERPGIVHRLDKDTSGCIIVAKNDFTHELLSKQFQSRDIKKVYRALVHGRIDQPKFSINLPIGRHPHHRQKMAILESGRPALTDVIVVEKFTHFSHVECWLHSGRTHQIRVHLTSKGHALLGDKVYGRARGQTGALETQRQMLHAMVLGFKHPRSEKWIEFTAPLPEDFLKTLSKLK